MPAPAETDIQSLRMFHKEAVVLPGQQATKGMKKNLGGLERLVRAVIGAIAVVIVFLRPDIGISEGIVVVLAIFLLLNAITGRCYLWRLLGLNTAGSSCDLEGQRSPD